MAYFIDYNAVSGAHDDLNNHVQQIKGHVDTIKGHVQGLDGVLDENTKASYNEQYNKWSKDISEINSLVLQYRTLVGNVHDLYQQGDQAARKISENIY